MEEHPEILRGELVHKGGVVPTEHGSAEVIPRMLSVPQFQRNASGSVNWHPHVHAGISPEVSDGRYTIRARPFEEMHGIGFIDNQQVSYPVSVSTNYHPNAIRRFNTTIELTPERGDEWSSNFRTPFRAQVAAEAMMNRINKSHKYQADKKDKNDRSRFSIRLGRVVPEPEGYNWKPREIPMEKSEEGVTEWTDMRGYNDIDDDY